MNQNNNSDLFDQYYTKQDVSIYCCHTLLNLFGESFFNGKRFLEPSSGTGSFVVAARKIFGSEIKIKYYDIEPKFRGTVKADFLKTNIKFKHMITIGNPPFGKRASLAIDFFNKAGTNSDVIAFIVPIQFEKYSVQHKLNQSFKLVYSERLNPKSFIYNDKDCSIRCVFQIWTSLDTDNPNLRILTAPKTSHPDFELFLHNNTKETLKYFDKEKYGWDFAVPRQGFYDYSLRIKDEKDLRPNVQYMFFKSSDTHVLDILSNIDYKELSLNNTTTPGYGKADVVAKYLEVI